MSVVKEDSKELIIHKKEELLEMFSVRGGLSPVLERLKEVASDFTADLSTKKGRDLIASQAYAVSKSKTYLNSLAKDLTQEWRDKTTRVNTSRGDIQEFCDDLRDEIRKPLTEWENIEKEKVIKLKKRLSEISSIPEFMNKMTDFDKLKEKLKEVESMDVENDGWGDLEFQAFKAKDQALTHLKTCVADREEYEKEKEELRILRENEAKRKKEDDERAIKEEADRKIAQDKKDEEEKKAREKIEQDQRFEKAKQDKKLEQERIKREELEQKDRDQRAEIERIDAEKRSAKARGDAAEAAKLKAISDKEDADKRAKESNDKLKKMEEDKKAEDEAKRLLEEDAIKNERENKKVIHNLILDSLVSHGLSEEIGKEIITLIGRNLIPNIKVDYSYANNLKSNTKLNETKQEVGKPSFRLD